MFTPSGDLPSRPNTDGYSYVNRYSAEHLEYLKSTRFYDTRVDVKGSSDNFEVVVTARKKDRTLEGIMNIAIDRSQRKLAKAYLYGGALATNPFIAASSGLGLIFMNYQDTGKVSPFDVALTVAPELKVTGDILSWGGKAALKAFGKHADEMVDVAKAARIASKINVHKFETLAELNKAAEKVQPNSKYVYKGFIWTTE